MKIWFPVALVLVLGCGGGGSRSSSAKSATTNVGLSAMDKMSVTELIEKLNDATPPVRHRASLILGKRGDEVAAKLIAAMNDDRHFVREGAAKALQGMGEGARPAVPTLIAALCDEDAYVRREAGDALLKLGVGNKEVVTAIESLQSSSPPTSRKWATEKLATYGSHAKPAVQSLIRMLNDEDAEVRAAAAAALHKIDPDAATAAGVSQ